MSDQAAPLPTPVLADDELAAWLRLLATPGVGRETARRLLAAFGSPQAVFAAGEVPCRSVVGVVVGAALNDAPAGHGQQLAATRAWLAAAGEGDPPRRVMVLGDSDYPPALLNTADPPLLLYLEGCAGLLTRPSVAIVGSRKPTPQGRENARAFGAALVHNGWTVVSGLAAGVDGAAHEGALQALAESSAGACPDAGGPGTVAVIGTGIDVVYPPSHKALTRRIARLGLLVSELPLGAPPLAPHFPLRNRVIAGLSRGTLVVEAALRSGSLITARLASEAGREVFALPGSIHSDQSAGCHALIRQGATLVTSVEQVLDELGALPPLPVPVPVDPASDWPAADPGAGPDDDAVLRALGHDPASLDVLMARCGWPAHELSAHLLTLELSGRIVRLPGGLYQRIQST